MDAWRCGSARTGLAGIAVTVVLAVLAAAAHGEERWAALSLLGDRLSVVYARMQTGTHANPHEVRAVPTRDDALDRLALRSLVEAPVPGVPEIVFLSLRDPRLYEAQEKFLAGDSPLREAVLKAVSAARVTHLLLMVRTRGEASFRSRDGHIGVGQVEGLGFYVDRLTRVQDAATGTSDVGYLAPFAYYRLVLFDIARGEVVGDESITASTTYPVAGSQTGDPWELVSAEKKTDDIARLLSSNSAAALRRLVASRPGR